MMKNIAALVLAAVAIQAQAENLTVVSFGGTNKDAQDKAFYKPFMASGKDSIEAGEYNGEMARIRAMVETKQVGWDVVELEPRNWNGAVKKGCLKPWTGARLATKPTLPRGA